MSSATIEINNVYGSLLISDTHPSLACREKGTIATNTPFTVSNVELPLMAFRCGSPCLASQVRSSNSITYEFVSNVNDTVTWYYHDRPVAMPIVPGAPVAQAHDSLGRCTFEGMGKVGRVVGTSFGAYPAGREYAAVLLSTAIHRHYFVDDPTGSIQDRTTISQDHLQGVAINGATVSQGSVYTGGFSSGPWQAGDPPPDETSGVSSILILDVTGY